MVLRGENDRPGQPFLAGSNPGALAPERSSIPTQPFHGNTLVFTVETLPGVPHQTPAISVTGQDSAEGITRDNQTVPQVPGQLPISQDSLGEDARRISPGLDEAQHIRPTLTVGDELVGINKR